MERTIIRDEKFLAQPSQPATYADLATAQDLLDTLAAHAEHCAGLAANMIGIRKCIIAIATEAGNMALLNPQILRRSGRYLTQEGCLSLDGQRPTVRYEKITVAYQDLQLKQQRRVFSGWTAQIIQHELDHCQGILI